MDQASEVFKTNEDHSLLGNMKTAGFKGEKDRVDELAGKFEEHSEQLQEVGGQWYHWGVLHLDCNYSGPSCSDHSQQRPPSLICQTFLPLLL